MSKLKSSSIVVAFLLLAVAPALGQDGTEANPYLIDDVADLVAFRNGINRGTSFTYWNDATKTIPAYGASTHFRLTADLDLSTVCSEALNKSWIPIGTSTNNFKGNFQGGGHAISKLYINASWSYQGLFGCINGASIDSLNLAETEVKGSLYVGGVCGSISSSTISHCYYDKQMCTVGGINGSDASNQAVGLLTVEMTGTNLRSGETGNGWTSEHFTFTEGMYPRPNGIGDTDAAIVGATPVFLANEETADSVATNFTVGIGNGVTWAKQGAGSAFEVSANGNVAVSGVGSGILAVTLGNATKLVTLVVPTELTIDNLSDLVNFRNAVNDYTNGVYKGIGNNGTGFNGIVFKLTADIDLSSECAEGVGSWTPIGTSTNNFKGSFQGGGHTISKLYINTSWIDYQGLFGYVSGASIDGLNLAETDVTGSSYVGGVCGRAYSSTISCTNSGSVSGAYYIGGVCGYTTSSTISYCGNSGSVIGSGEYVGGVCGWAENSSTINYCTNSGSVSGSSEVGGVCGRAFSSSTISCTNSGSVSGSTYIGGVCGRNSSSTISYCYYDKQMCTVGGINGNDASDQAAGLLTAEMTGTNLKSGETGEGWTSEHFTFTEGMYPRPNGTENTDAAIVGATPVFLTSGETTDSVATNFTVGIGNGVTWTSSQNFVAIEGNVATLLAAGNDTLTVTLNGISKQIPFVSTPLGGSTNPFVIDEVSDLQALAAGINTGTTFSYWNDNTIIIPAGGAAKYFKLTADIDLSSVCAEGVGSWTPIGTGSSTSFKGNFQGGGHTISKLYINSWSDHQGLFGYISGASIDSFNLAETDVKGSWFVGGVCGSAYSSTISYCTNSGSVSGSGWCVGGVCGEAENSSTISHCSNSGSVSGGRNYVGGVCGQNYSTISYSANSGSVSGSGDYVGGVCGQNYSTISYSANSGSVSGSGDYVGGVCGQNYSTISYCANSGSVSGSGDYVGGVYGQNYSTISYCYYDKQMCTVGGINGSDAINQAVGLPTAEMTGTNLRSGETGEGWTSDNFTFIDGLYPRVKNGFEGIDAAIVGATPVFLANGETVDSVATNFTVGIGNGVTWTRQGAGAESAFEVSANGNVTVSGVGSDILAATLGNATKLVTLVVPTELTIDNLSDLVAFRNAVNDYTNGVYKGIGNNGTGFNGIVFKLTTDIDLSSVCAEGVGSWTPIGTSTNNFKGSFHGGGHTISKLYINASWSDYQGLFGYVSGASIDSLNLAETEVKGYDYVGGVCGVASNSSTIIYCTNSGSVIGSGNSYYVGGVCGSAYSSTISYCTNSGSVSGRRYIGGVCGGAENSSTISHCSNSGSVSGSSEVGGVCGQNYSTISYSANSGSVSGSGDYVGGVCGQNSSTISYSANSGSVSGSGDYVGGVCGRNYYSSISYCYYDKQMCTVGGINGSDASDQAAGLLTAEMTGTNLKSGETGEGWFSEHFTFTEGMYPRPNGTENTDAAIVGATPVFLTLTTETVNSVTYDFMVGVGNNVVWTSKQDLVTIDTLGNATVTCQYDVYDTLTVSKNAATKSIALRLLKPSATSEFSEDACDSYSWDGTEYTTSGDYTKTYTAANGCDSTVTMHLTIRNSTTGDTTAVACDEFVWYGATYTQTPEVAPTHTFTNAAGCDSVVTLNLTINNSKTSEFNATACDSYTWNSQTYTTSGNYEQTLQTTTGCDSVVTLNLTINSSKTSEFSATACNSYTWNSQTYATSGNYEQTLQTTTGCDSIVTLHLTINYSNTGDTTAVACDEFVWYGTTYTQTPDIAPTHTFTNAAGCDSVVTLNLTINQSTTGVDVQSACDSYTWIDGETYTQSTSTPTWTLTNAAGCDSVVTLNLTIIESSTGVDVQEHCDSYTWIDGVTYTESTSTPTFTLTNAAGCDSVVTLNLTINQSTTGVDVQTACGSFTWIDGVTYTESTSTPTWTLTNAAGCDSVVTLNLTINQSSTGVDVQTACGSYTWIDGETYTESTSTPTWTLTNAAGCDSVVTLNLTINQSTTGIDVQEHCDSYTWIDGVTYTESTNTPTFTLTNAAGCDSVVTLNLTINQSSTGVDVQTACDSFTWIDGVTYTESTNTPTFTLTNAAGCDSVVTLNLTILESTTGVDVQEHCDSFTWIDGVTYTNSTNTPTWTLTNAAGCDSVVTLNLTINQSTTGIDVQEHCDSYTWIDGVTYTESTNTPTWTLTNAAGCDSVVTLNLTINELPTIIITGDSVVVEGQSITLTASGAETYVWSTDETTAEITVQPIVDTEYSVVGTDANGCSGTQSIYIHVVTGVEDVENSHFMMYPNPANNMLTVQGQNMKYIELYNAVGKLVSTTYCSEQDKGTLTVNGYTPGLYIVKVYTNSNQSYSLKLIVER